MSDLLKLNLGSGQNPRAGYLNVDRAGTPDLLWDLENVPWPWETSSVGEVVLDHVLEHLGEGVQGYFAIIKQLYRVCAPGATIHITVPHPRHDDFLGDPTHVRAITQRGMSLFSKALNRQWGKEQYANSPLGLYLDVDLEVESTTLRLEEPWASRFVNKQITEAELNEAALRYNNVVKEICMVVKVIKPV
jgi:hypothetical protein